MRRGRLPGLRRRRGRRPRKQDLSALHGFFGFVDLCLLRWMKPIDVVMVKMHRMGVTLRRACMAFYGRRFDTLDPRASG